MIPGALEPGPNARKARFVCLNAIEQELAGIMPRLRNAAASSRKALWRAVGKVLDTIEPAERANCLRKAANVSIAPDTH